MADFLADHFLSFLDDYGVEEMELAVVQEEWLEAAMFEGTISGPDDHLVVAQSIAVVLARLLVGDGSRRTHLSIPTSITELPLLHPDEFQATARHIARGRKS